MDFDLERKKKLEAELPRIIKILREKYQPDKVLLFGSLVSGRVKAWSDIDLVIIKSTPKRFIERLKEVALLVNPSVGVDFFVYTPEEFDTMTNEKNSFHRTEMLEKGKVLYDKG